MRWGNQPIVVFDGARLRMQVALTANQWSLTVRLKLDDDWNCDVGSRQRRVPLVVMRVPLGERVTGAAVSAVNRDGDRLVQARFRDR